MIAEFIECDTVNALTSDSLGMQLFWLVHPILSLVDK